MAVLMDDQKAKNEAVFSCQFSYQLAHGTAQKLRNFLPVHSVRDQATPKQTEQIVGFGK